MHKYSNAFFLNLQTITLGFVEEEPGDEGGVEGESTKLLIFPQFY